MNEAEAEIDPVKYLPPIIIYNFKWTFACFGGFRYRRKILFVQ